MPHYYDVKVDLKSEVKTFVYHYDDEKFIFQTDNGVFAKDTVDYASRLLIDCVDRHVLGKRVLDYGCGWGPIGIILKRLHPSADIDLVDINERAIALAKSNAKANRVDVNVFDCADITSLHKTYDTVVLNPPIRAGKVAIYDMYKKAHAVLDDKGKLFIVIKTKHGARSHFEELSAIFKEVVLRKRVSGHWLISADKG